MTEFVLNRGSRQLTFKMVNSHPICPFNRTPVKRILSSFQNGISVSLQDGTTGGGSASSFDRDAGKTSSSGSSSRSFDMDTDQSSDQDQHQEVGNAPTEPNAPKRRERKEIKDPIRFRQVLFLNTKEMMKETDKISRMQGDANPNKPMPTVEEKKNKKDKKDATPILPSELDPNQLYSPAYIAVAVDAKKPEDTKKDTKGPTRKPIKNLPGPETRDGQAKDQPGQNPHGTISKLKDMLIPIGSRPRPMSMLAEPLYSDPAEFLAATGTPLLPPQRIDPHKSNQTINKAKDTKNNKKVQSGTVTQTNTQRGASNNNNSPQSTNKMSIVDQLAATLTRGNQIEGSPQSTTKRLRATGGTGTTGNQKKSSGTDSQSTGSSTSARGNIKDYELLADTSRRLGQSKQEGASLFGLGVLYDNSSQYKRSIKCYERFCLLSRRLGDKQGEEIALNALGNSNFYLGTIEALTIALDCHERHEALASKPRERFVALTNLGLTHAALGNLETGVEYLTRALQVTAETGDEAITNEDELKTIGMLTQLEDWVRTQASAEAALLATGPQQTTSTIQSETALTAAAEASATLRPCLERQLQLSLALSGPQQAANTAATLQMMAHLDAAEGKRERAMEEYDYSRRVAMECGDVKAANASKVGMGIVGAKERIMRMLNAQSEQQQQQQGQGQYGLNQSQKGNNSDGSGQDQDQEQYLEMSGERSGGGSDDGEVYDEQGQEQDQEQDEDQEGNEDEQDVN